MADDNRRMRRPLPGAALGEGHAPSLTASQAEAVFHFRGPCEVIAGPGSGKTFVLVQRLLFLLRDRGVNPSSVLVLTFSRAAAAQMRARFLRESGGGYPGVTFGTFHAIFYAILRESLGRAPQVITTRDQTRLLRALSERFWGQEADPELFATSLGRYRSLGCRPGFVPAPGLEGHFLEAADAYESFLRRNGLVDFDDMLLRCRELLTRDASLRARWQARFSFLLVDEFQDVGEEEYEVLRILALPQNNLFVVGDDDQSIYSFRGSDPVIMQRFLQDYPDCRKVVLAHNFRSRAPILRAAGLVIRENETRISKKIRPVRKGGEPVQVREFATQRAEYDWICEQIRQTPVAERKNLAVIFRTHARERGFLQALQAAGLLEGSLPAPDAALGRRIRELIAAYLRLALDLQGGRGQRRDFVRIANHPMRALETGMISRETFGRQELTVAARAVGPDQERALRPLLRDLDILAMSGPSLALRYLLHTMGLERELLTQAGPAREAEVRQVLSDITELAKSRKQEGLGSLVRALGEELQEQEKKKAPAELPAGIHVITMHASKGLEYSRVIVPDLVEGVVPSPRSARAKAGAEEERRLFYVAMTRAKDTLELLVPKRAGDQTLAPSRFLVPLGVGEKKEKREKKDRP